MTTRENVIASFVLGALICFAGFKDRQAILPPDYAVVKVYDDHGEPVGADYYPGKHIVEPVDHGVFYCRDAKGRRWPSHGECD